MIIMIFVINMIFIITMILIRMTIKYKPIPPQQPLQDAVTT